MSAKPQKKKAVASTAASTAATTMAKAATTTAPATTTAAAASIPPPDSNEADNVIVRDNEELLAELFRLVKQWGTFESSVAQNSLMEEIGKCRKLNDVFETMLRSKAVSTEAALTMILALHYLGKRHEKEFDSNEAMDLLSQVFDLGVQHLIIDVIDQESDSDSDADDAGDDAKISALD